MRVTHLKLSNYSQKIHRLKKYFHIYELVELNYSKSITFKDKVTVSAQLLSMDSFFCDSVESFIIE